MVAPVRERYTHVVKNLILLRPVDLIKQTNHSVDKLMILVLLEL